MDPLLAAALGALGATVVIAVGAVVWWTARRRRDRAARSSAEAEAAWQVLDAATPEPGAGAPLGLAGLVPLVFGPVHGLLDAVSAASNEVRSLFAPGGEVGLLFSDIVDSTRLNRRLGDEAWAAMIARHDEVTGQVVRSHGGRVVKRQGDGFMAAFHDAAGAVDAALALGPRLRAEEGPLGSVRLRIGVHHGQVVTQQGDHFGMNVAMAARVAGAAGPDEVLVSQDVVAALGEGHGRMLVPRRKPERLEGLPGSHTLVVVRG